VWNVGHLRFYTPALVYLSSQIWSEAALPFPGTMGKDKSWLSWLLTGEINHCAHRRIPFQAASWELHYPAPASYYYAYRLWLVLGSDIPQPTSVSLREAGDQSSATDGKKEWEGDEHNFQWARKDLERCSRLNGRERNGIEGKRKENKKGKSSGTCWLGSCWNYFILDHNEDFISTWLPLCVWDQCVKTHS